MLRIPSRTPLQVPPTIDNDRADSRPQADTPSRVLALVRPVLADPFVRLWIATVAVLAVVFLLPVWTDAQRATMGEGYLDTITLTWPVVGAFAGLRRLGSRVERRFWSYVGIALSLWIAVLWLYLLVPTPAWNVWWDVATDTALLLYYTCLLLALGTKPHLGPDRERDRVEDGIRIAGLACLSLGWLLYALVVPAVLVGARYNEQLPVWLVFLTLDLLVAVRLAAEYLSCDNRRWRLLYAALLVAVTFTMSVDVLDALAATHALAHPATNLLSFLWTLPAGGFVVAIRLRHVAMPAGTADGAARGRLGRLRGLMSVGSLLVLGAFSFPVIHLVLDELKVYPPAFERPGTAIVLVSMLVMGSLAVVAFVRLEQRRARILNQQRDLEERFRQAQKMESVGRLAGGVAHDFNNLLTAISGFTDLASEELAPDHAAQPSLAEVHSASDRATALTRQLLAFSRRQLLKPEPVLLNRIITALEGTFRRLVGTHIQIVTDLAPDAGFVCADPAQVEQVLLNLVVNAHDAMPHSGTLTIATDVADMPASERLAWPDAPAGPSVRLRIRDTGVGISPDILPQVFEPFFTTKPTGKGTGLGLSTVYGIIRQSGGAITVSSEPGRGTCMSVYLARIEATDPVAGKANAETITGGTETILLAEDADAVRDLAQSLLQRLGYTVLTAEHGERALALHREFRGRIDLLFTDVVMPGMSGRVLAERILEERPGIKVLFMTGYTDDAVVQHRVLDGAFALLPKPFTRHALASEVRRVLDHPAGQSPQSGHPGGTGQR